MLKIISVCYILHFYTVAKKKELTSEEQIVSKDGQNLYWIYCVTEEKYQGRWEGREKDV